MEYIRETTEIQITEPTVISLGKFDGLHMGHKLLVDIMQKKKQDGLKTVMFTFDIPPRTIVDREMQNVLTTNGEKEFIFSKTGMDYLIEYPFTEEVRTMEPEAFIEMLVRQLNVKCIVAGKDFRFGHNRSGNYETLEKYSSVYGYEAVIVEKKEYQHREISSTYIREEIQAGNMETANMLLGYEYFVKGKVVHGKRLGRTLGIPTVNLLPPAEKLLPPFGVYVSRAVVGGKPYGGITNVGRKPTVGAENPVGVETHIFDFCDEIYGTEIEIQFLHFLRKEKKFDSVEGLKGQIEKDIESGRAYLKNYKRRKI